MARVMTKSQPEQDELARSAKRGSSHAASPAMPVTSGASPAHGAPASARHASHHDASHNSRNDQRSQAPLPALGGAYAAPATYQAYTSSAPAPSRGAHAHVAPSSMAVLPALPMLPTLPAWPTAPTRLEASLTTVGDLARRYPSVAAFVQAGLPAPFEPAPAPAAKTKHPKQAPSAKSAQTASHVSKPAACVRQRFAELRAALAEGWEIVQPIFARPLWSVADDSATAFNFVLSRAQATRLVTVPDGRTVSRFIRDQQLVVDYRR